MCAIFLPSADATAIEASVRRRGIREIYHFTRLEHVPSIFGNAGLHPRTELRARGVEFNDDPSRWSNDLRKAKELSGYLATSIARPWGMMRDEPDCVVFSLNPRLLWRDGSAFIGGWSSSNEIRGVADLHSRERVEQFDAMFDNPNSGWPAPLPGEVLIRGSIALDEVVRLYARDVAHAGRIKATLDAANLNYHGPTLQLQVAAWIYPRGER